jgi:small subunit ribosomal protein S8
VDVPATRLKTEIAKVLLRERFINNFKVIEDTKQGVLRIYLKYSGEDMNVISGIRRMSTPGRRVYVGKDRLPRVMGGLGMSIVSTSRGLMTDREAREAGLGGELLAQVW